MRRKVWMFALVALFLVPQSTWKTTSTWKQEDLLAFQPVLELMQLIASAEEAGRDTVSVALTGFMERLVSFLRDQGVPAEALDQVMEKFAEAQKVFLEGGISASEFGERVAALARELQSRAEEQGVQGVPQELLQEIGLDPEAIEALRAGEELDPEEIVEIAEEIAEETGAPEDEAPPDEGPPPEEPPPDEEPSPDEGPPPDEASPPEGEPPPDDAPPPDDEPPPDEPPPDDEPPSDDGPPPDEPPPDPGPPPDDVPPAEPGP